MLYEENKMKKVGQIIFFQKETVDIAYPMHPRKKSSSLGCIIYYNKMLLLRVRLEITTHCSIPK